MFNNKRPLDSNDIDKLISYQTSCKYKQYAADFWKLIYFWMGMNLRDVILLKKSDLHDDKIFYYRKKTYKKSKVKRMNTVFIDQRTSDIMKKYEGAGCTIIPKNNFLFLGIFFFNLANENYLKNPVFVSKIDQLGVQFYSLE